MSAEVLSLVRHLVRGPRLQAEVASGDALDVRDFVVRERLSALSEVDFTARSKNPNLAFGEIIGQPAALSVEVADDDVRCFRGICRHIEQTGVAEDGLATYRVSVVPSLWLATQRRNYRIFQQLSDPDIALQLLGEWGVDHEVSFDRDSHKRRKYRVQYGESDFTFICRLLEDAGISFYFGGPGALVLRARPDGSGPRRALPVTEGVGGAPAAAYATNVTGGQRVRPGKYTLRHLDHRRATGFPLYATERSPAGGVEVLLERYHYVPGAFLFGGEGGDSTPAADDRGAARTDPAEGKRIAQRRLQAKRAKARFLSFDTTAFDLRVGSVVPIVGHPHDLMSSPVLVVATRFAGAHDSECRLHCEAVSAAVDYVPSLVTPKPKVNGVESATVVGPAGEEIHTDEMGRVRVHFHWDRDSRMDEMSSCWIPLSQPWGGAGYGGSNLPRVGQEVIVDFLGGDPDRPVVVGRLYTAVQPTPYALPEHKTRSGWRSSSSPGGGGFNELMFEDKKGRELLYLQAERDMTELVKHDQEIAVRHDRKKTVENDETVVVNHDRTEAVANDEGITVGHDRSRVVGHDDKLGVGNDRTSVVGRDMVEAVGRDRRRAVAHDEKVHVGNDRFADVDQNQVTRVGGNDVVAIGKDQTLSVGECQSTAVAKSQSTQIGESLTVEVGASHSLAVGRSSSERVAVSKDVSVGASLSVQVGGAKSESVGGISTEQVGLVKRVQAGQSITLQCGAASIVLMATGEILINGTKLALNGSKGVKIEGEIVELN